MADDELDDEEEPDRAHPRWEAPAPGAPGAPSSPPSEATCRAWVERHLNLLEPTTRDRIALLFCKTGFNPEFFVRQVELHQNRYRLLLDHVQQPTTRCPHAGADVIVMAHGTSIEGLCGILRDRAVRSKDWRSGGAGNHGIYGRATTTAGITDTIRVVRSITEHNKNMTDVILEMRARAVHCSVGSGGIKQEAEMCRKGYVTSYQGEGRWCMPEELAAMWSLWVNGNAALSSCECKMFLGDRGSP